MRPLSAQGLPANVGGRWSGTYAVGILPNPLAAPPNNYQYYYTDASGVKHYLKLGEIAHAVLLPPASETSPGPYTDRLLLWGSQAEYYEVGSGSTAQYFPVSLPDAIRTHKVWILDPAGPSTIEIPLGPNTSEPAVNADIFCSGHTLTREGWVIIGGGLDSNLSFPGQGAQHAYIFNPAPAAGQPHFTQLASWSKRRWYPTLITLANGDTLTFSGLLDACFTIPTGYPGSDPLNRGWEILPAGTQQALTSWVYAADAGLLTNGFHYYTRMHVTAGGKVFAPFDVHVGPPDNLVGYLQNPYKPPSAPPEICYTDWPKLEVASYLINPASPASVTIPLIRPSAGRWYANSTRLVDLSNPAAPAERIIVGYGSALCPTKNALETSLLNPTYPPPPVQPPPPAALDTIDEYVNPATGGGAWLRKGSGAAKPRFESNAVIYPDGTIFYLGGSENDVGNSPPLTAELPVFTPEMFNPGTPGVVNGTWTQMNPHQVERLYHSIAILLRDGRILYIGGKSKKTATPADPFPGDIVEIFSPPQLFIDPRPSISPLPSKVMHYGQAFPSFQVQSTVDLTSGSKVTLIGPGSVTHHWDSNGTWVRLQASVVNTLPNRYQVTVTAPPSADYVPPGWYMMFVVTPNGTPSVGEWVLVKS